MEGMENEGFLLVGTLHSFGLVGKCGVYTWQMASLIGVMMNNQWNQEFSRFQTNPDPYSLLLGSEELRTELPGHPMAILGCTVPLFRKNPSGHPLTD